MAVFFHHTHTHIVHHPQNEVMKDSLLRFVRILHRITQKSWQTATWATLVIFWVLFPCSDVFSDVFNATLADHLRPIFGLVSSVFLLLGKMWGTDPFVFLDLFPMFSCCLENCDGLVPFAFLDLFLMFFCCLGNCLFLFLIFLCYLGKCDGLVPFAVFGLVSFVFCAARESAFFVFFVLLGKMPNQRKLLSEWRLQIHQMPRTSLKASGIRMIFIRI